MKFRSLIITTFTVLLAACNFSLAEDITPPPNYAPPTPMPTLGPLYPAAAPNIENGAAIYAEKCAECHGPQGLGDGEKGKQLPVTVAALGLPLVGQVAKPSDWYAIVTRGNIERYMPPFTSLTDQERWDVITYALTLHTDPKSMKRGKGLFDTVCADCPVELFRDQEWMASISNMDLAQFLHDGNADFPGLADIMTEGGFVELAFYVRTLSFAAPTPTPVAAAPTQTVAAPEATPSALPSESTTPVVGAETPVETATGLPVMPEATGGKVTGSVSGQNVGGLKIVLHGFDHASDASGPQESLTLEGATDDDGNFVFEGVDMPEGRIFYADASYEGVAYNSDLVTVAAGAAELSLAPIKVYPVSGDYSALVFDQVHFFASIADGNLQMIGVYTFSNASETAILVDSATDVPFIKIPAEAGDNFGFQLTDDSAPLVTTEAGFAIPPSETPYGIVAFYALPYESRIEIAQQFAQPASSVLFLVPEGVKLKSAQLTEGEMQNFQGTNYREYGGAGIKGGDTLTFELKGNPKSSGASNSQKNILVGAGALGGVLILAGAWMYLRDRSRVDEETDEEEEIEYEGEEEILDAIIALDDQRRAGKIPEEAYQARREELKARLKN